MLSLNAWAGCPAQSPLEAKEPIKHNSSRVARVPQLPWHLSIFPEPPDSLQPLECTTSPNG